MSKLALSFRGAWSFEEVREALGDGLSALGDPPAPWVEVSRRPLDDRNGAGLAFEGVWRRGEATLAMSSANGLGDPRDGYGYEHSIALDAPRLSFRWRRSTMAGGVDGLDLSAELTPEAFRALRRALAGRLGGDATDLGWTAVANVEALAGVDPALQREVLAAALAQTPQSDSALAALMKWKVALLGAQVAERVRACPADLDAWVAALASPSADVDPALAAAGVARLAPWDPSRPQHRLAPAWRWLPALGGSGEAPDGWRQLDDGADPPWVRPALAATVARALCGFGPDDAAEVSVGGRRPDGATCGAATARARHANGPLPRIHVAWSQRPAARFSVLATVDWVWGDGDDDVLVLAARRRPEPETPVAMFLSGTEAFRAAAMAALHGEEPFAWRPVARPLERPFTPARAPSSGARADVEALLARAEGERGPAAAAFRACRCARAAPCAHRRVVADVLREAERRRYCEPLGPRARWALDALAHACRAAQADKARMAGREVDLGWRALAVAAAVTDAP